MKYLFAFLIFLSFTLKSQCDCGHDSYLAADNPWLFMVCGSGNDFCPSYNFDGPMYLGASGNMNTDAFTTVDGDWMLIIDDEFNGTLDSTIWLPRMPWSNDDEDNGYRGVTSLEVPENLSVNNGMLHLRGKYDNNPGAMYKHYHNGSYIDTIHRDWTSSTISSHYAFPMNSRYQFRAKMFPNAYTTASAIWLYGNNDQEIDIQELYAGIDHDNESNSSMTMGVHGKVYGYGPTTAEYVYFDTETDVTQTFNQYDLIWDKWKTQFWFNSSIPYALHKYYYCDPSWLTNYMQSHIRQNPIHNFSDMNSSGDYHCAVLKNYPDYSPMCLIIGMSPAGGDPSIYTASNTMDVDYVKIWLRADCGSDATVNALNFLSTTNSSAGGTAYAMGRTVATQASANLTIPNLNKGVFAATDEVALLDGFSAEDGSLFQAFITSCDAAWDNRMQNPNNTHTFSENMGVNTIAEKNISAGGGNVQLTPNPNDGNFSLLLSNKNMSGRLFLSVYTLQGGLLIDEIECYEGKNINLSKLENGTYYVKVRDEDNTVITAGKLIIAK